MKTVNIDSSVITSGINVMADDSARFRNDSDFKGWVTNINPWSSNLTLSDGLVAKHTTEFEVGTFGFKASNKTNLVIPLQKDGTHSLLVFDQTYNQSAVWIPAGSTTRTRDSDPLNIIVGAPKDTAGVTGLTGAPVPSELESYVQYGNDFYFGLSGTKWDWEIGKGAIFSADQLQCTGAMGNKEIASMILWFDNTEDEVYNCINS